MPPSDPKAVTLAFFKAFWAADLATAFTFLAPGATFDMMPTVAPQRVNDAREALQRIIDTMFTGFSAAQPLACEVTSLIADGTEVALEYIARARTVNDRLYENFYSAHVTVAGGKITRLRTYADTAYLKDLLMLA